MDEEKRKERSKGKVEGGERRERLPRDLTIRNNNYRERRA